MKFKSMWVPSLRPLDCYADMVKTDVHMVKVKGQLLAEKRKIGEVEERRKARQSKKVAREVQAQKTREREQIGRRKRSNRLRSGGNKDNKTGLSRMGKMERRWDFISKMVKHSRGRIRRDHGWCLGIGWAGRRGKAGKGEVQK